MSVRAGPQQKKKHRPWCFFFAAAPPGLFKLTKKDPAGPQQKKKHNPALPKSPQPTVSSGPAERSRRPPSPAFCRGRSKKNKNTLGVFLFLLWPRAGAQRGFSFPCLSPGPQQKKKHTHTLGGVFFCSGPVPAPNGASPSPAFLRGRSKKKHPGFLLWPRAGAQRGFSFPCLAPGPEQTKHPGCFFYFALAPCRRPRPDQKKNTLGGVFFFALAPCRLPRPEQKKNTLGGVFFLLWPRAGAQRGFSFPWLSRGPEPKKKHPGWCFFFCSGPVPAPNGASPSLAFGRSKKKTPWVVFIFLFWPRAASPSPAFLRGRSKKKTPWVFALAPCRRPTGLLLPLPFPGAGAKRNTLAVVFFFALAPCRRPTGLLLPLPFPGAGAKKKHPGWCFFLLWPRAGAQRSFSFPCLLPRGRSKKKHPGWCFFFCSGPVPAPKAGAKKKTPWLVFFFLLWPRAGAQRGFSFPCLSPGPEQKKNTLGGVFFFFCSGPVPAPNGLLLPLPFPGAGAKKKNTLGGVFFLLWPRAGAQRGFSFPCLSPGPEQKKKTPWVVFFFLLWPRRGAQRSATKKKNTLHTRADSKKFSRNP